MTVNITPVTQLPYPDKYDIIPVHASDRGHFKFCRRQWDWGSPARRNLIPKVTVHGVRMPLWFGTGIHYALEKFYNPVISEDPVVTFEAWYALEWNGGIIREDQLKQYADRLPKPNLMIPGTYVIEGLKDLLPEPDVDLFEEHRQLGIGMMSYYKDYAAREDNFRVLMVEHEFSIPILKPDGHPLYARDTRTMTEDWQPNFEEENNYGPLMKEAVGGFILKQVHARGRMDTIIQENEYGNYGIIDFKTASQIDDDYFRHLDLDEQCTTYLWAAEREAHMYDLEYKDTSFIIYQAMRKAFPRPPTMTSRGLPSVNRQSEATTPELFEKCIKENGLEFIYRKDIKLQAYYDYLVEIGDRQFIQRGKPGMPYTTRNKAQRHNAGLRLYYESQDMLFEPHIYPNPTKTYPCLNCTFREPCVAAETGEDYDYMLNDMYMKNYDR